MSAVGDSMSTFVTPPGAVLRVSRGTFDPERLPAIARTTQATGPYLVPAIRRLDGLLGYDAGLSSDGSLVPVSLWDTETHADQMGRLREMVVDARRAAESVGGQFAPIVNHPIAWSV